MGCSSSSPDHPTSAATYRNENNSGKSKEEIKPQPQSEPTTSPAAVVADDASINSNTKGNDPGSSSHIGTKSSLATIDTSLEVTKMETPSTDQHHKVIKETEKEALSTSLTSGSKHSILNLENSADISEDVNKDQETFDAALRSVNLLVRKEELLKLVTENVTSLILHRGLPHTYDIYELVTKLTHLQVLDFSGNAIGPQAFRAVCMMMCSNTTILQLNMANNMADIDSAECIGRMLSTNRTLQALDISSNYFGKDYFSRCIGPALKGNFALQCLRAESVGATDLKVFMAGLLENSSLTQLDVSNNDITDRSSLGKLMAQCLLKPHSKLTSVSMKNCNLNQEGLEHLRDGLVGNTSLNELNLSGNEFGSLSVLYEVLSKVVQHPTLTTFFANDAKISDRGLKEIDAVNVATKSPIHTLSLSSCSLTDAFWDTFCRQFSSCLRRLADLDITNNTDLSAKCLNSIFQMTSADESEPSSVQRLSYGLNNIDSLFEHLVPQRFAKLLYLNLRKAHISSASLSKLSMLTGSDFRMETVVLDGIKISGTDALKKLLGSSGCGLSALSLSGCSVQDTDLKPLVDALRAGLPLHMLKLSANRITDIGVTSLVESLTSSKTQPLAVLDLSNNQIQDAGATKLSTLFTSKIHTSNLHSLNLSSNSIGLAGLTSLVCVTGAGYALTSLYMNGQKATLLENDINQMLNSLAISQGFNLHKENEIVQNSSSDLPSCFMDRPVTNVSHLGGETGEIGILLDSVAVVTDYKQKKLPWLTLSQIFNLIAALKANASSDCVLSGKEWDLISGAHKDAPSWLQVADSREKAVYLCNLPGNATVQKLEALFEMEADCNVNEICLMKDPVTRKPSGVSWVLMADRESVQRALDLFARGEAQVFSQPFLVSSIRVKIDDEANKEAEMKARNDLADRQKERRQEDSDHRRLIQQSAEESWKRHAYRLAHPAYADGRVW